VSDSKDKDKPKWFDVLAVLLLRMADSGLLPWMLVAGFLLTGFWLMVKNLSSGDTLALINKIATLKGLAMVGWLVAIIQVPMYRWAINRARNMNASKIKQLEDEVVKAREQLKAHKLGEFRLEAKQ
jgi:uncharacterized membrane protein YqhA